MYPKSRFRLGVLDEDETRPDVGLQTDGSGNVTTWLDQSPDGNNASGPGAPNSPTVATNSFNGKPVVNFNEANLQFLQVTGDNNMSFTAGNISSFYVAQISNYNTYRDIWSKSAGNGYPAPVEQLFYAGTGEMFLLTGNGSTESTVQGGGFPAGSYLTAGFTVNNSSGTNFLNYGVASSGHISAPEADGGTPLRIGCREDNAVLMDGNIAEILIYDRPVLDSERGQILNYLAYKWGVVSAQLDTQTPSLTAANVSPGTIAVSYPPGYAGYVVQTTTNLASGVWTSIATNLPNNQILINTTNAARFFRLAP